MASIPQDEDLNTSSASLSSWPDQSPEAEEDCNLASKYGNNDFDDTWIETISSGQNEGMLSFIFISKLKTQFKSNNQFLLISWSQSLN